MMDGSGGAGYHRVTTVAPLIIRGTGKSDRVKAKNTGYEAEQTVEPKYKASIPSGYL